MKKSLPAILGLIGFALMAALLAFMFTQHGTNGLYHVNGEYRLILSLAGAAAIILLVLSLLYLTLRNQLKGLVQGILTTVLIIGSVIGIIVPPAALAFTQGALSGSIGDTPPQLLMADGTGANGVPNLAVAYNSTNANADTLTWGKNNNLATITEPKATKNHVFNLTNLAPTTTYTYKVNQGQTYSFTTPSTDGDLHFAMSSDAHFGASDNRLDYISAMLGEIKDPANAYDMLFFNGDIVDYGFSQKDWGAAFNSFSSTTSSIPVRYAIGNHESLFAGFNDYLKFAYPAGMETQTGSRLWYRIDVGKIHFLVLDLEWSAESFTKAQADWLEAQLKSIPAGDWKIVMSHGFYYASGGVEDGWKWYDNPETIEALTPLFEQYKVDMVFSGHAHQMELLQHNGVTYSICGAFVGAPDVSYTYTSPASLWMQTGKYGFVEASISGNKATLTFRDQNYGVLHSLTVDKHS